MTDRTRALPADAPEFTLDEVLSIKHPDPAAWSPDGAWLAWRWDDGGLVHLWAARVDGGRPLQVSRGETSVSSFQWGPDGRLAFAQGGDIWIAAPGDEPTQLTRGGGTDAMPTWSPSGQQLAFARDGTLWIHDLGTACVSVLPLPGKIVSGYGDTTSIRWSPSGARLAVRILDGSQRDLVVLTADGTALWRTETPDNEVAFAWVDDRRLHYTAIDPSSRVRVHRLVDVETGAEEELAREESERGLKGELPPVVHPAGAGIAYVLTPGNWPHLFYRDLSTGELRQLTDGECDDTGHAGDSYAFSPDGARIVYSSNRDTDLNQRRLWLVDVASGESTLLTPGPGTDSCAAWSPDGRFIAFVHCGPYESPDIWVVDPTSGERRQISHSMPETLTSEKITLPTHITYPSEDGLAVHADLFLPKGFDPERRYPAIVWVHGGMARQMRYGWHPMRSYAMFYSFHQYLLHRGYVILSVDYRGSIGYGREYEQATYLSMCQGDLADVVAGARYLASLGYVDPESIAVYGLSYGGYLTLGALTKYPEVFALGINIAGIWDYEQYNQSREEVSPGSRWHGLARLGGPKGEHNAEAWYQASPRNFVQQMTRPLLNLMGTADEAVDYAQIDAIIRDCVEHGKDFAVVHYPGESHMFTWRKTWEDAFPRIERAFQRYLTVPPSERPPAMI